MCPVALSHPAMVHGRSRSLVSVVTAWSVFAVVWSQHIAPGVAAITRIASAMTMASRMNRIHIGAQRFCRVLRGSRPGAVRAKERSSCSRRRLKRYATGAMRSSLDIANIVGRLAMALRAPGIALPRGWSSPPPAHICQARPGRSRCQEDGALPLLTP